MRFFITPKGKNNTVTLSKKDIEALLGFEYLDDTVLDEGFMLPPYKLALSTDITPRSELPESLNIPEDPLNYLHIYHDKNTGWNVKAKKDIPANTAFMYAGVVSNNEPIDDDYTMVVPLPHQSQYLSPSEIMKHIGYISPKKKGNLSRLFPHLPKDSALPPAVNPTDVATENLRTLHVFDEARKIPMVFLVTTKVTPEGSPIGFDYGVEHFRNPGAGAGASAAAAQGKLSMYYFSLDARSFSGAVLAKITRYNEKWKRILDEDRATLAGKTGIPEEALRCLQFLRYQDLCDLACTSRQHRELAQPLLSMIRAS